WMEGLISNEFMPSPDKVGQRFIQKLQAAGQAIEFEGIVMSHDRPRNYSVKLSNLQITLSSHYRLTPVRGGTEREYTARVETRSFATTFMKLLYTTVKKIYLGRQMRRLKELTEAIGTASILAIVIASSFAHAGVTVKSRLLKPGEAVGSPVTQYFTKHSVRFD